jgi:hypothetical protein
MTDTKLTLTHRLELEKELRQVRLEEEAHTVRLTARREVAEEVANAQTAVTSAEDVAFKNLPTPLPENAAELVGQHPVVAGRRYQLERFEQVFGPARIEQAESIARAITSESTESTPATPKQARRVKQSGTDGGSP